jgi:hypothetical protein
MYPGPAGRTFSPPFGPAPASPCGSKSRADNDAAMHLYESLGFARHCRFYEALAMP